MVGGVRWSVVGSVILGSFGVIGVLAGCSGGFFTAERETWRHEAEVQCLASGAVKETANVVRIQAIQGPGMCGADFPLKVMVLGEGGSLGYSPELRPPGSIPNAAQPRWPGTTRSAPAGSSDSPVSLTAPGVPQTSAPEAGPYDYRRPYGTSPTAASPPPASPSRGSNVREPPPGTLDISPVPYERRRVIDGQPGRGPARPVAVDSYRNPPPALPALGPSRGGPSVAGPISTAVAVSPAATLACPMVSELDRWIVNSVQPAAMRWFGVPVAEIKQISAYSCRGMNGNPRARISEHAFGNALDIAAFTLADGRKITVKNGWRGLPEEQGFLRDVQGAACDQFTTVLAPGSNVFHYDHIHVDLMRRSGRACNPSAVSGEEVAAKVGGPRYSGGRRPGEVTGSVEQRRAATRKTEVRGGRALPLAEPGNDGEDD
ncbi:MAG: extensin family protein [Xanthobacteraceae bacterium]